EHGRSAVTGTDRLVERRGPTLGRARLVVGGVAPAEAVEAAAPLLEEGDDGVQVVERFHAPAGVVAAARIRPAGVALLRARAEHNNVGAALRTAVGGTGDGGGKAGFVEHGVMA